jgi:hypothetical protein
MRAEKTSIRYEACQFHRNNPTKRDRWSCSTNPSKYTRRPFEPTNTKPVMRIRFP